MEPGSEIGNADRNLIDNYLAKVEKNLKGFTREAKDSILIEIREHILDRAVEEPSSIETILEEYGKPEEVARSYSPIIRLSNKGARIFQGYSLLISLFFLYYTFPQFLHPVEGFAAQRDLAIIGMIGTLIAYACIFFNLTYVSDAEKQVKFSRFSLYANTLLGAIFLFLMLSGYFHTMGAPMIEKGDFLDEQYADDPWYFGMLLLWSGILSHHISHLGHSFMTRDTKDGIAPYQNISTRVFPLLLVMNVMTVLVVGREMWETFEYISRWNSEMAYWVLGVSVLLTILPALLIFLHHLSGMRMMHIEREVFAVMVVVLILTSGTGIGFYREEIELEEGWDQENSEVEGREIDGGYFGYYGTIWNGTMYTRETKDEENNYTLTIHQWDDELALIVSNASITFSPKSEDEVLAYFSSTAYGKYIHIKYLIGRPLENDELSKNETTSGEEMREYWQQYVLADVSGRILSQNEFPIGNDSRNAFRRMVVSGEDVTLVRYNYIENKTATADPHLIPSEYQGHRQWNSMNITTISLSMGKVVGTGPINGTISFEGSMGWSKHIPIASFVGWDPIWIILKVQKTTEVVVIDQTYLSRISINGTVETPLVHFLNETRTRYPTYKNRGNLSLATIMMVSQDLVLVRHQLREKEYQRYIDSSYVISDEASVGDLIDTRVDHSNYDPNDLIAYNRALIDEMGKVRMSIIERTTMNGKDYVVWREMVFDPNGSIISNETIPLEEIPYIQRYLNEDGGYDGIRLSLLTFGYFRDEKRTYQIMNIYAIETVDIGYSSTRSKESSAVLIKDDSGIRILKWGEDLEPSETKNEYFLTITISIILGLTIPTSLWFLMKKRSQNSGPGGGK
jgi:hypothetical protein